MKSWKLLVGFGLYFSLASLSFGTIGYINQTFRPGFSLRATQLSAAGADVVSNHLASATNGFTLFKMAYKGFEANNYLNGWDYPDMPLEPGEAWFIKNPTDADIHDTIVGEIVDGTNSLPEGFSACSSIVPQAGLVQTDLLFPAQEGDQVFLFNESNDVYTTYTYSTGAWTPTEPPIGVAQSFWVRKDSALDWSREFSIDGSDVPSIHVTQPHLAWTTAQLNFFTYNVDPLYGRVYGRDGITPLGSDYAAQVYAGDEAHDDSGYVPLGSSVLFPDGLRAGYISANTIEVPFLPGGDEGVYVQLRVWDIMRGTNYEAAAASGALCGKSIAFKLIAHAILENGHPGIPPPDVNLFPCFSLGSTPVITSVDRGTGAAMVWGRGIGTSPYVLEGTTNLIFPTWTTQDLWTSSSDGTLLLLDYDASNHPVRFYRMSEP